MTADAVGDQLNWVNSIRREFREAARDTAVEGWAPSPSEHDIYEDIVRLLARPGGGFELDRLVGVADGDKRRGLTRAIQKKAHAALGSDLEKGDGPADVVFKLLVADEPALAAWAAFERMAWSRGPDAERDAFVELVEQDDGLRAALGDYWTDWLALPGMRQDDSHLEGTAAAEHREAALSAPMHQLVGVQSEAELTRVLGDVAINRGYVEAVRGPRNDPAAGDRADWAAELQDLRQCLFQAVAFDGQLLDRLKVALERLEPLVARALERSEQDSVRLGEEAARQLGRLRDDLKALGVEGTWRAGLIAGAERVQADPVGIDLLKTTADWAAAARAQTEAAAGRRQAALDRAQTDDSDEAGAELTAANAERRRVRQIVDGEAAAWMVRFSADAPESPGDLAADKTVSRVMPERVAPDADLEAEVETDVASEPVPQADNPGAQDPELPAVAATTAPESAEPVSDRSLNGETVTSSLVPGKSDDAAPKQEVPDDLALPSNAPDQRLAHSPNGRLVERALGERRYGLAAHLQRAVETLGLADASPVPSDVLEALCIGSSFTASRLAAAEHRYAATLPRVLAELARPSGAADRVRLLAFAGALKPALFSMQTSAAEAIRAAAIGGLGTHLHELSEFVLDELPKRGGVIDLAGLRPAGDEQAARDELERLRAALLEMADEAPAKRAMFARATIIWREQFQKDGTVARAIAALRRPTPNAAALAQEAAEELEGHLGERARELDRAAKRNRDSWLEGRPLEWLLGSLRQLADLLHGYAVAARRAAAPKSTHSAETQKLLAELVAAARRDVAELTGRPGLAVAAEVAESVLGDVSSLLAGRTASTESTLGVDALLDGDLLLIEPYPAAARRRALDREGAMALLDGAHAMLDAEPSFAAAFASLVAAGRFHEAAEAAERAGEVPERQKLDQDLADARLGRLDRVGARAGRLRTQLDDLLGADTEGRIDPAASVRLESLVGTIMRPDLDASQVAEDLDFPTIEAELDRIEITVQDGAELLLAPLRREIEGLEVPANTAAVLLELAERRELTALRECVDGLRQGADMDLAGHAEKVLRSFSEGFLSAGFAQVDARQRNVADLLQAARERRDGGVVDFSLLAEEDVPAAEGLLAAWVKLKRAGPESAVALREVLTELRFTNVRISEEKKLPRAHRYSVLCDATFDRRDCPVPAFGSASNGRLEVLVLEAVNVADGVELHGLVKGLEHASTIPTLVIVKGVLPADRRLAFMREARRRAGQESCALLDEAGILFLATWPGRRRADTYAVAMPSGGVQPYSDASGKTSPEMFFGRAEALGELWRADGSCLVFGGRQLGKTALLEQVRRRNHKAPGQIVVYGSFQGETDIWRKVAQLLNQGGLPVKGHSAGAVETAVREGLKENAARRILILIDEADTYLEKEMQEGYPTLARVRDLMQATDRRCKFVFAGLHNVQRLARAPNSPLLHFGTPLRIGPLFGHDLGEAREMVVGPMAAAGIVFENATLPNRILSAVGFYPSLLQTFGATLIERVNRNAHGRLKPASPLPIVVSDHDIQNALEDHDFKENIRNKFRMTLSLDERYRLITLAMLQRSLERRDQTSIAPSLTDVEVQALARDWWPQGFEEDSSLDAFQGLLQEMVGLGVLVESGGRYAIRSSRIAAMLGGKEQIDRELVELSGSPGPETLDTGSLRRLDRTSRVPSPLTSRQEGQLLGQANAGPSVHLALGSEALGLDRVAASLAELQDDELAIRSAVYKTARELGMHLANAREQARAGRRSLMVLNGPWLGREMIEMALEAGARRVGRTGVLRVLIAPAWIDWSAADDVDDQGRLWGAELLSLSTLGRSGLGQWLRARGVSETPQTIETLRSLTGGFPAFLNLGRGADVMAAARDAQAQRVSSPDILDTLGLGDERLLAAARIVADFDPEDLAGDLDDMGVGPGTKVIGHLERLGVLEAVQAAGDTRWRLNPFVATVLSHRS